MKSSIFIKVDWLNPACQLSAFFTVAECTKGDDRRIPEPDSEEEANILAMAQELDAIRDAWGSAIGVTSWYRPEAVNTECGGVSNSQHITGGAVDIYPIAEDRGQEFEDWLDSRWGGGLGWGQASGRGFTHIDLRGGGYLHGEGDIRWQY
jgi:hypothetical protein